LAADRHAAGRIVRRTARGAGIVTPHLLRHVFITAALDAGVPLRDVQEAASHADLRTTHRYSNVNANRRWSATWVPGRCAMPCRTGSSMQLGRDEPASSRRLQTIYRPAA
jgi:integrase